MPDVSTAEQGARNSAAVEALCRKAAALTAGSTVSSPAAAVAQLASMRQPAQLPLATQAPSPGAAAVVQAVQQQLAVAQLQATVPRPPAALRAVLSSALALQGGAAGSAVNGVRPAMAVKSLRPVLAFSGVAAGANVRAAPLTAPVRPTGACMAPSSNAPCASAALREASGLQAQPNAASRAAKGEAPSAAPLQPCALGRGTTGTNWSAITLRHLLDSRLIHAGPQALKVRTGKMAGQTVALQPDGTLRHRTGAFACPLDLLGLRNGLLATEELQAQAWSSLALGRWPLQHYKRVYCLISGAVRDPPSPRAATAPPPPSPAPKAPPTAASTHASPPPMKRTRRQATTVVSYAQLANEGAPERPPQPPPAPKVPPVLDAPIPAEVLTEGAEVPLSLPLAAARLRGIERFTHLQPVPAAEPARLPAAANAQGLPPGPCAVAGPAVEPAALQALDRMNKLPPMPRKVKTLNASQPRAPPTVPSTTAAGSAAAADAQRARRDVRTPARMQGVSGLTHTMMQLEAYSRPAGEAGADAQPFSVDVHPMALASMDIHAHLCQNEVIGVLGGLYDDAAPRRLRVLKALAVQEGVLDVGKTDVEMDPADQSRAVRPPSLPLHPEPAVLCHSRHVVQIEELRREGLQCVGWYHSHPTFAVWPSAIDVYNQQIQQAARSHEVPSGEPVPYIAAIVGPYDQKNSTSQCSMSWFYVENRRSADFSLDADPEVCLQHMVPKLLATGLLAGVELPAAHITACAAQLIEKYAAYGSRTELRAVRRRSVLDAPRAAACRSVRVASVCSFGGQT
jgi:proteasome lid subunit RPN8/RPN11